MRPARHLALSGVALFAALGVLTGCAGDDDPPPGERVVTTIGGGADPSAEERTVSAENALAGAEAAWREGDPLTAYTLANQALRSDPPDELANALRALRSKARAALVGTQIVDAAVLPRVDAVASGTGFGIQVLFTNRSTGELRIPARLEKSSQALLLLELFRRDIDVFGNSGTTRLPLRVPLEGDLFIPPGGRVAVDVAIPPALTRFTHQGFAVLDVTGSFRPVVLQVGDTEFFDALELAPAPVRVFMPGFEQLTKDPLSSLEKAIAKRSPPHILTAAELLAPADREQALALLSRASSRDPELAFVLEAATKRLRVLRGEITDE